MMLCDKHPHSRDACISFEENGHKYTINGDTGYKSVTTITHSFFPEFNSREVIQKMMSGCNWSSSPYYGMTEGEIILKWEDNRNDAAEKGTKLHKLIEDYYNDLEVDYENMDEFVYFIMFDKEQALNPYRTEWMIWDKTVRIAGSIDMIAKNDDGTFTIYDWKRAKKIHRDAFGGKCSTFKGLSHIPDTNYWHYALQLNVYKYILETSYDIVVRDMFIVQIHPDLNGYNKIKMPTLNGEIDTIMRHRINDLNKK